jgi:hypothetical protein
MAHPLRRVHSHNARLRGLGSDVANRQDCALSCAPEALRLVPPESGFGEAVFVRAETIAAIEAVAHGEDIEEQDEGEEEQEFHGRAHFGVSARGLAGVTSLPPVYAEVTPIAPIFPAYHWTARPCPIEGDRHHCTAEPHSRR